MGSHSLLQGIFLTQGSNLNLLHCRQVLYHSAPREARWVGARFNKHMNLQGLSWWSVQFSHSVVSHSLQPHGLQHDSLPYPSLFPRVCSNSCPLSPPHPLLPLISGSDGKACSAGDPGSIPGLERYTGEGNGNPLQYSCLVNATDGAS